MMPYVLTNSEMGSWLHCRRCWYLGYYRKLRRIGEVKSNLTIGTLFHNAMEGYYGGKHDPLDYVRERSVAAIAEFPESANQIAEDAAFVGIMVDGYLQWVEETGADVDLEVYAAEARLDVEVNAELVLRGKLDARALRRSTGARVFLEHKTVQNLKDLPRTAQTNPQFLTYELLEYLDMLARGDSSTDRTDGVLLNMARKVKRTARANPPFYGREEIRFNLQELRNHWRHVVAIGNEILAARDQLDAGVALDYVVPPTNTRECFWKCSFSALCMSGMMDDGSDWEGMVADLYEEHDPLERYEEAEE